MKNKIQLLLINLIFILCVFKADAQVIKVNSITESKFTKILRDVDKDTMVLIEIDGALTLPVSAMFSRNSNPYRGFLNGLRTMSQKDSSYSSAIAAFYQQRSIKLIDNYWPKLISELQGKGAQVFGLYSTPIQLVNIEQKIIAELANFGIKFNETILNKKEFALKKQEVWFSQFYYGIISVGPYSRASTIIEFLRQTYMPKKVIVISNLPAEIDMIEAKMRVYNMKFFNILYKQDVSQDPIPKAEIVKFQQQQLIKNKKWIEDDVAARMLNLK